MTPLLVGLGDLLKVVAVSTVAGIGITMIFSVALLGIIRSQEPRRQRGGLHWGWAALGVVALLLFAAAVVAGVRVVAS